MRDEIFCGQDWNEDDFIMDELDTKADIWNEEQEILEEIEEDEEEQEYINLMLSRRMGEW